MDITPVDERDSFWEVQASHYRVYLFQSDLAGPPQLGFSTRVFDVESDDALEVIEWAKARASTTHMFAVAVVQDSHAEGRGLQWIVGMDANDPSDTASGSRRRALMRLRQEQARERRRHPES